jgi:hypothetical protein
MISQRPPDACSGILHTFKTLVRRLTSGLAGGGVLRKLSSGLLLAIGLFVGVPARALNIIVTYDPSVPLSAQGAFNQVVSQYDAMYTNPVTVAIDVKFAATGLASSSTQVGTVTYSSWRTQMSLLSAAEVNNPYLAAAVLTLPAGDPLQGLSGSGRVLLTFADALVLGYSVPVVQFDSTLTFSSAANTFEYNGVAAPGLYDFKNVAEHELNEALGIGSSLTGLANGAVIPAGTNYSAEDYFRYDSSGARAVTTSSTAAVFFSYNGTTDVAQFNQNNNAGGNLTTDRNDWVYGNGGCPATIPGPYVQDAIGCPNSVIAVALNTPESIVLSTLGYNPVPEPGTFVLIGLGLGVTALWRSRR